MNRATRLFRRGGRAFLAMVLALSTSGCVERTLILRSDPPGALVTVNGDDAGVAPVRLHFDTYGAFEVILSAPRHARLRTQVPVRPPWYERPGLDFFFEQVWPFTIQDVHDVTLTLQPLTPATEAGIDQRERELRARSERAIPETAAPATEGP